MLRHPFCSPTDLPLHPTTRARLSLSGTFTLGLNVDAAPVPERARLHGGRGRGEVPFPEHPRAGSVSVPSRERLWGSSSKRQRF